VRIRRTTRLFGAAGLAAFVAASGANAQVDTVAELATRLRDRIDATGLRAQVNAIVVHPRLSGSLGENAAIDHIVETLRGAGIPVDVHAFWAYVSNPVSASVGVPAVAFEPDAITAAYSGSVQGLEATAVDIGGVDDLPGIDRTSGELLVLEPHAGVDLTGKIALVEGLPMPEAAWALEKMGAAGAVFINPRERLNELITTTVWGTPSRRSAHRDPGLPVAQVRASAGERLRELAASGSTLRLDVSTETGWKELRLVVARIDPPAVEDAPYVLLGGHIDSWHYGATDEGASNAAMLELARAFWAERASLRRGLVVAWWPGHSNGRYAGSAWFADHYFEELTARGIAYMNIDGVGQIDAQNFSVTASAALAGFGSATVSDLTRAEPTMAMPGRDSDQAFNGIGLPQLQFGHSRSVEDGGYWWWHTAEDTIDKIDLEILEVDTELYAVALARLLAAEVPPLDIQAETAALVAQLAELQSAAGMDFDLSRSLVNARALDERATTLATRIEEVALMPGRARRWFRRVGVDRALVRILRPLHRVVHTRSGPFHPDPAVSVGLLPGLTPVRELGLLEVDSRRYGFLLVDLVRERNRLQAALLEATREADALIASRLR
jgi:hypothetical protein